MARRWKLSLAAALLIVGAYAITGAARTVRADTHGGCATFDASGNQLGFTPSCSETEHATPARMSRPVSIPARVPLERSSPTRTIPSCTSP